MKPREYSNLHIVMQDTTYSIVEKNGEVTGISRAAAFLVGRVVYLPTEGAIKYFPENRVMAWAEGLGTIAINRNAIAHVKL